jgi:hypothetical protein
MTIKRQLPGIDQKSVIYHLMSGDFQQIIITKKESSNIRETA